ncbi:uncharacterized protein LOC127835461 [Dreissena polymorpha]|uniref:uncharacterized protein LOC127835461 n=1 Tax=Dreissena polymorpha TaxID=45954 RepID=UPI0022651968|nr:uncharacterized protein LOC127835461 [Dreissena polymorpha]
MSVNKGAQWEMSLLISSVMDDIGVNEEVIVLRRNVHSFREKVISVIYETLMYPKSEWTIYSVGSQVEGSTTDGMCSDIDQLQVHNNKNVCLTEADYKENKKNVLVVKDERCSPQCCLLQLLIKIRDNAPRPASWKNSEDVGAAKEQFRDTEYAEYVTGQMLMSNLIERLNIIEKLKIRTREVSYSGPAINLGLKHDFVYAITCPNIPNCCKVIFDRPRPGHWPKQETLKKLKELCIFLVPNGPPSLGNPCLFHRDQRCGLMTVKGQPNSLRGSLLWRYTTNLSEKCLMFDLNIVQMKAYVVTKMIRKECFAPIIGDSLSTFHLKTALLFTVELFPPVIWTEPCLLVCVMKCLLTLKRFLNRRYCPHYTISGVNLFSEKLSTHEYKKMPVKLISHSMNR